MRAWYNGCALAFQADEVGSIPSVRSKSKGNQMTYIAILALTYFAIGIIYSLLVFAVVSEKTSILTIIKNHSCIVFLWPKILFKHFQKVS